ncbi:MAG: protein kinase [Bryobacteraceae bacterium]|nr:protein kinase [Bryobacteraceae bacterium]
MTADRWARIHDLFELCLDQPPESRKSFLHAQPVDPEIRFEVQKLLDQDCAAGAFMDESPDLVKELRTAPRAQFSPGERLANRFELLRLIGRGGMGEVYAALDADLEEQVAVKVLHADLLGDSGATQRFRRELQLARKVTHANVCRLFDLGRHSTPSGDVFFLTMELVEGETLADRLRRTGPLKVDEARPIVEQLLHGLSAAHQAGIIHRDLKPSNIMLTGERAVIMDFGLARRDSALTGQSLTSSGKVLGTLLYMAPEQLQGQPVTERTDIYALGLLMYELTTGQRPFGPADSVGSVLTRLTQTPAPPTNLAPDLPRNWSRTITAALELDPQHRPATAQVLLDHLQGAGPRRHLRVSGGQIAAATAAVLLAGLFYLTSSRETQTPPEAVRWYRDGQQSLADGGLIRARGEFERSIELAPRFAPAHAARAEALLEMDMTSQARDAMLVASEAAPDRSRLRSDEVHYLEGIHRLILGDCPSALTALEKMTQQANGLDKTLAGLVQARALMRCNQPAKAETALQEAAKADGRNAAIPMQQAVLAARRRDYPLADNLLSKAEALYRVRDQREGSGQVMFLRAVFLEEQNRLDESQRTLDRASEIAQTSPNPLLRVRVALEKGLVYRQMGDMPKAEEQTTQALRIANQNGLDTLSLQALFAAGNIHLKRYELGPARDQFLRALDISERFRNTESAARAQMSLGSVYVRLGKTDEAIQATQAALPFFQSAGQVRNVANGYLLIGQALIIKGDFIEAEKVFANQLNLALERKDVEREAVTRENLATAQAELGKLTEALHHYRAAVEIHKRSGKKRSLIYALTNASDIESRLGHTATATQLLDESRKLLPQLEKKPADLQQRVEIGSAYLALRSGDYRSVVAASQAVLQLGLPPNGFRDAQVQAALCYAAGASGQPRGLLTYCQRAIEQAQSSGRQSVLDTRLIVAQAYLRGGLPSEAELHAAAVAEDLAKSHRPEGSWAAYAIRAWASGRRGRHDEAKIFAREASLQMEKFRLYVKDQDFDRWLRRADIAAIAEYYSKEERTAK